MEEEVMATVTSDKGFYVGDVCYQLSDEDYDADWHKSDYSDFEGEHELRGHKFAIAGTKYGDGEYEDQQGHNYPVDSGTIGILPLELCQDTLPEKLNSCGRYIQAKKAKFSCDDGVYKIEFDNGLSLYIDTTDETEEDDEDYDEDYDEEYDEEDDEEDDDD